MITIEGEHSQAIVYSDELESSAREQILTLCNQGYTEGGNIRVMPDVHAGAGCTIGTTMKITDKAVPNLVGVDIGCGMETIRIRNGNIELQKLDKLIYDSIPSGFKIRKTRHRFADDIDLNRLRCVKNINLDRAYHSIGTLGGGNHFIEADKDEDGNIYIVIHSGSRHMGLEIAKHYQKKAFASLLEKDISDIPFDLAYVEGGLFEDYLNDMGIAQKYAELNRKAMMDEIIKGMKLKTEESFTTVHNYIDLDAMILRKGAVSATEGEKLLIPINMRDGSLICKGKGNDDWNQSAPHGAGRLMSRTKAKSCFTVNAFKNEMEGIYTTSVGAKTLDECPMAYKSMDHILRFISPTADIERTIRPIYNFKSGEE